MANKRIGQAGLDLIKQYEGCRLAAYRCAAGVWTIGYGHTAGVHSGMTITQAQADAYLQQDIAKFEGYVNNPAYVPITEQLNQNQFDALVSFAFNLGAALILPAPCRWLCNTVSLPVRSAPLFCPCKASGDFRRPS